MSKLFVNEQRCQRLALQVNEERECWFELETLQGPEPTILCDVARTKFGEYTVSVEMRCSSGAITPDFLNDLRSVQHFATVLETRLQAALSPESVMDGMGKYLPSVFEEIVR